MKGYNEPGEGERHWREDNQCGKKRDGVSANIKYEGASELTLWYSMTLSRLSLCCV